MSYISTFLGNRFYPLEPRVDDIHIEDIAHGLAYTCRFNGQTTAFYSVAQHSLMVADLVAEEWRREALLHDAAEAYLGDVVKPLKLLLPEYRAIEDRVSRIIAAAFGLKDLNHPEIKLADRIALATEKRDLMPNSVEAWDYLHGITPRTAAINPLAPQDAKNAFLEQFALLQQRR